MRCCHVHREGLLIHLLHHCQALREIDDLKDQLRVQNEVVENVARMKTDIHTKQAVR